MNYFPWIIPSIVACSICASLALLIWRQRKTPAAKAFYWYLLSVFIWSICQSLIYLSASLEWKIVFGKIQYVGIVFTPVSYLLYSAVMLNYVHLINGKRIFYICIIPLITLFFAITNEYHHLMWEHFSISQANPIFVSIVHGKWFTLHTIYSYGLILLTATVAIVTYYREPDSHVSIKSIIFAPLIAMATNLIYLQDWVNLKGVDLTPMGFAFALLIISWTLLKEHVLQLVPIARDVLFQKMKDSIVLLGKDYRIVDLNISAEKLFKVDANEVTGTLFTESISDDGMLDQIISSDYSEVTVKDHYLQALRTLVTIEKTGKVGYLIVFRDITQLKETENSLLETRKELELANKTLQTLANTDPLTGLPNRRHFFQKLVVELERAARHKSVFSLLVMDLDEFKKVNDVFGHPAGDLVLKRVAKAIKHTVREADYSGRIGGEEFGIILTETAKKDAKLFAERIRKAIEECHSATEVGTTVSIGLTQRINKDTIESIYDRADKALYQSKANGRNKTTSA